MKAAHESTITENMPQKLKYCSNFLEPPRQILFYTLCKNIVFMVSVKFVVFSLSGKATPKIPCFTSRVATLSLLGGHFYFTVRTFRSCQTNSIFTASKRSLRQGNVFTPVCHSVHRGRGVCPTHPPPGCRHPPPPEKSGRFTKVKLYNTESLTAVDLETDGVAEDKKLMVGGGQENNGGGGEDKKLMVERRGGRHET